MFVNILLLGAKFFNFSINFINLILRDIPKIESDLLKISLLKNQFKILDGSKNFNE
jgi:hypothetical protein